MSIFDHVALRNLLVVGTLVATGLVDQRAAAQSPLEAGLSATAGDHAAMVLLVLDQRQHLEGGDHSRSGSHGPRGNRRSADRQRVLRGHGRGGRQGTERTVVGDDRTRDSRRRTRGCRHRHVQLSGLEPVGRSVDQTAAGHAYLVSSERRVQGPRRFQEQLPAPKDPFQDVAVLAFPAPLADAESLAAHGPKVSCVPARPKWERPSTVRPTRRGPFRRAPGKGSRS